MTTGATRRHSLYLGGLPSAAAASSPLTRPPTSPIGRRSTAEAARANWNELPARTDVDRRAAVPQGCGGMNAVVAAAAAIVSRTSSTAAEFDAAGINGQCKEQRFFT